MKVTIILEDHVVGHEARLDVGMFTTSNGTTDHMADSVACIVAHTLNLRLNLLASSKTLRINRDMEIGG